MALFGRFLLTMAVAFLGAYVGRRFRLPAGSLMGAMILVVACNVATGFGFYPKDLRVVVQLFSGALVGSRITKRDVLALKKIVLPAAMLVVCMAVLNLTAAYGMHRLFDLDAPTALYACAPGGLADMSLLSGDMGANPGYVALLQLARQQTIFLIMPVIFRYLFKREARERAAQGQAPKEPPAKAAQGRSVRERASAFFRTMLIAAASGLLFWRIGVRSGAMIGAMLGSALYNILTDKAEFLPNVRQYTQTFTGAYLGMSLDKASLLALRGLIGPALLLMAAVLIFTHLSAFLIHKTTKLELTTCMIACTPGGLSEMALLADDLGGDAPKVALMQTVRMTSVVALFPSLLSWAMGWMD